MLVSGINCEQCLGEFHKKKKKKIKNKVFTSSEDPNWLRKKSNVQAKEVETKRLATHIDL